MKNQHPLFFLIGYPDQPQGEPVLGIYARGVENNPPINVSIIINLYEFLQEISS